MTIFHIRSQPLARKTEITTLCGAPTTIHDEDFQSRKVRPTKGYKPCHRCIEVREQMRRLDRERRAQLLAQ
jgi:hypothetical protein